MGNGYKEMPPEDLRQLQLIQLEMLLEVDRICKNLISAIVSLQERFSVLFGIKDTFRGMTMLM